MRAPASGGEGTVGGWGRLGAVVLALAPIALLATWLGMLAVKGPYWLGSNSDPDYAYLINGLGLAYGYPPGHVDHPGTPLQLLVAVILRTTHLLTGGGSLADDVLARPEFHLLVVNGILLVAFAASLALAGLEARRATGSLLAGLAVELLPGLAPVVVLHVICVKPEPLLATLVSLLAARTLLTLAQDGRPGRVSDATAFGVLVGLAVATKVSAVPLAVLPLPILRGRARSLRYAGVAAGTFALATLPAWPAMAVPLRLLGRIATHSGQYGSGAASLLDAGEYFRGLRLLATETSGSVALALALGGIVEAVVLSWRCRHGGAPRLRATRDALVAATAMQVVSVLFVARHAASHYLLPAIALSGLTAALAVHGLVCLVPARPVPRRTVVVVMACLLAMAGQRLLRDLRQQHASLMAQRDAQLELVATRTARFPGARVLHFYRSSSLAFALHFGDMYDEARWSGRIQALHPRHLYYNRWAERLEAYRPDPARPTAKPLELRPLTHDDLCGTGGEGAVVVQGPLLPDAPPSADSGSVLRSRLALVFASGDEALYRPRGCSGGEGAALE